MSQEDLLKKTSEVFGNRPVASGPTLLNAAWKILETEHGFESDKTLFIQSTCPDEINRTMGKSVGNFPFMNDDIFHFGGLGGIPQSGRVGLGACCSHIPDGGRVVVLFGPHIGMSSDGTVAKVKRRGIATPSTSCGAAVGACNILCGANFDINDDSVQGVAKAGMNEQMMSVIETCKRCHDNDTITQQVADIQDKIANFTTKLYHGIETRLEQELILNSDNNVPDKASPVCKTPFAFIGGIQVNTDHGVMDDIFVPMQFELWTPPEQEGGEITRKNLDVDKLCASAGYSR